MSQDVLRLVNSNQARRAPGIGFLFLQANTNKQQHSTECQSATIGAASSPQGIVSWYHFGSAAQPENLSVHSKNWGHSSIHLISFNTCVWWCPPLSNHQLPEAFSSEGHICPKYGAKLGVPKMLSCGIFLFVFGTKKKQQGPHQLQPVEPGLETHWQNQCISVAKPWPLPLSGSIRNRSTPSVPGKPRTCRVVALGALQICTALAWCRKSRRSWQCRANSISGRWQGDKAQ